MKRCTRICEENGPATCAQGIVSSYGAASKSGGDLIKRSVGSVAADNYVVRT
jgi:hypothetical protein